jgi:aryl-alcohol dehydrogenase-like predicted oxidoreductase
MQGASPAGTSAYAERFQKALAAGSYRKALGLTVSSVGLGTYLGRDDDAWDQSYLESIVAAVSGGINVIDSAINYRLERSERVIGEALRTLEGFSRGGIVLATKGGYVPSRDPEGYFREKVVKRGLARAEDLVSGCHSVAPGYLRHQLLESLQNLGVETIDIYHLHNPEQQLEEVDRPEFARRMRAAFECLEDAVSRGSVSTYGTATWNGYRVDREDPGALCLEDLVVLAREVAGDSHHFRVVQLPFNLAMPEALTSRSQTLRGSPCSFLEAAEELGIVVMTSASILQGRLARGLPPELHAAFPGLETDALRALQFARSAPGVTTALVGMGHAPHVRENLKLLEVHPVPGGGIAGLFPPED